MSEKPLIGYYGGKQKISSKIVERIRQIPHTVYAEPFAGGLAVLFAKGKPAVTNTHHYREAINDHDERLITLYRVARTQPDELQRWMKRMASSQAICTDRNRSIASGSRCCLLLQVAAMFRVITAVPQPASHTLAKLI